MSDTQNGPPPPGTVYLVGAGPGDPGLLTLRGRELALACDAIVYDRLAAAALPSDLPAGTEMHYVGKRASRHSLPQEEINALLVRLARAGKSVCRFKGGDPYVFGRGGEEALALREAGIPFEVVPGVTAGIAAAAYAGIPATHRGESVRLTLVTAHEDPAKGHDDVDWRGLGCDPHGTVAAYMPVKNLGQVAARMIAGGCDPDLPAAVIEHGTLPSQRTIAGTIGTLAELVRQARIQPPALLIIGPTVGLRDRLAWFPERPLRGRRVLVTRPADQAADMIDALRRLGLELILCPVIRTEPAALQELAPLRDRLGSYHWLFFTSENGVRYFRDLLWRSGLDLRAIGGARLAAVGSGTAEALLREGLRADFVPEEFRGETLGREFVARERVPGLRVLRVRGDRASAELEQGLRAAGAEVDTLLAYRIVPERPRPDVLDAIAAEGADAVTFTSGSSVRGFEALVPGHGLHERAAAVCIGPVTARAAREAGWREVLEAEMATVEGLVRTVSRRLGGTPGL